MHDEKITTPTDEEDVVLAKEEVKQQIHDLRALSCHPGWLYMKKHLEDQVDRRVDEIVLLPIEDINKSIKMEYVKGECSGIKLALLLPSMHAEILEAELLQREEAEKEEETLTFEPARTFGQLYEEDENDAS